ncbi:thiol-disulfide oxidoreductase DCC family protein [Gimesia sp.]|uniref:thiol-disulfide oxidoreductase DCC family protein n=1 Tax=Gimesia sp. TaxID=2024833 RepID=UPI003A922C94
MKKSVTTMDPNLPNSPVTEGTHPEEAETSRLTDKPILFFDGVCGLCNSSVDFAMARDRHARLYYAPLQGETARALLSEQDLAHVDTVVFRTAEGGRCYRRSAAVVRLLWLLGFPWNICGGLLWCIPLPLRNLGYRMIASVRYRLFGKHETCRMPSPEERARLLP